MAEILLSGSNPDRLVAFVDDVDYRRVITAAWYAHRPRAARTIYAKTSAGPTIYMHRLIMDAPDGIEVDHIDGNGLNNRRSNLRLVTHAENLRFGADRRFMDRVRRTFDEFEHLL